MAPGIFLVTVNLLLFALPVTAAVVDSAASTILALLFLMGIWAWLKHGGNGGKVGFNLSEKGVMIAFTAYFILAACFMLVHGILLDSYQPDWSLGHEIRMLAFAPVFYVFLRADIKPAIFWYAICAGAIASGIFACFNAYILDFGGRIAGAYHPIHFGDAAMAFSFMCLGGLQFFARKNMAMIIIPLAAAALGLAAVFLAESRGAFVAGPVLLLVFLIQVGSYSRPWLIRWSVVSGVVIVTVIGLFMPGTSMNERLGAGIDAVKEAFEPGKQNIESSVDPSTAARLLMWEEAVKIFRDNPWIGTGMGGFKKIVNENAKSEKHLSPITKFTDPHNMYLTSMTSYGIVGLAMLMGIFIGPLVVFIRWIRQSEAARDYGYAGVMVVLAYMQFALTASVFWRTVPIAIYLILTAAAMALCKISSEAKTV